MPDQKNRSYRKKEQAVNLDTLGLEMGNIPPQALDAEESVLGAMLLEPSCVDEAMEELTPNCFYDQHHRMIFEAMSSLVTEHIAVDLITVSNRLKAEGQLSEIGGAVALADLSQKVGAAANMEFYIKILKQKTIQRDLIKASYDILKKSYDDSVKVDDLIDMAQSEVYAAIQNNVRKEVQDIGSIINAALGDIEKLQGKEGPTGVPSGFNSIDRITQGWQPSDLIILAARPSVGKTAFALNLARNAAVMHHMPVAFFSLEMSAIQLAKRLMTSESGLSADKIKGGVKLEPYEWEQLEYKLKALAKAPLYIDDTPGIPVMEFRTKIKTLVKNRGVRLVFVDYLQLMQGPAELRGMREQEVAAISRTLKATAKELNVPIIALSQLSRNAVQRQGGSGKPQLSDLRESGSIEQDADMVIFIHRPDYVGLSDNAGDKEATEIIIAKHRNGETADIDMRFKSEQIKFMEMDDSLDVQASRTYESGMNSDLGGGFPSSFGASEEFDNPAF
ncbi:MAG: replicative DNA helicase [Bacteroidales bacterium]|nr:replicative DNA helicase [Bacteroidales bacterium]